VHLDDRLLPQMANRPGELPREPLRSPLASMRAMPFGIFSRLRHADKLANAVGRAVSRSTPHQPSGNNINS